MPNPYSGVAASYQTQVAKVVNGATNTTPIVAQTSTAHGYSTGDLVVVAGVSGNTAANSAPNAPWPIVVVDATHVQLVGSVGNGAFSGNGRATNLSLNPALSLQSDADADNASGRNVPLQTAADRLAFLAASLPYWKVQNVYQASVTDDSWAAWASHSLAGGTGWDVLKNGSLDVGDIYSFPLVPLVNHGDALATTFQLGSVAASASGAISLGIALSSVSAGAIVRVDGAALIAPPSGTVIGMSFSNLQKVSATGLVGTITAFSGGKITLTGLTGMSTSSVGDTINVLGAASAGNNGAFVVTDYISATSVKAANASGVAPDANNGALIWFMTNMKVRFHIMWDDLAGGSNSYVISGHRSMQTIHYRPPFVAIPLL